MSKIVYICYRDSIQAPYSRNDIELLSTRLTPDNISPLCPLIIEGKKGVLAGIFSPADSLPIKDLSICLGGLIGAKNDWWVPGAEAPDGSYALFRSNETTVELLSDMVASRTIWYVKTEDMFIASTSQRAIVFFLQDYEPNKAVYPWMLSSGTLGPGLSWDSRIRCLGGNARLILDRTSWKITIVGEPATFSSIDLLEKEHEAQLRSALEWSIEHSQLDSGKWILALSGGYDSRAILLMLKNRKNLSCVTWGLRSSLYDKNNDACIAKSLASHFGLQHEFFETDISNEPIEEVFNRFLVAGEGRVDHISAYMDGFEIWKRLFEVKISGIIRGDEGFGWVPVSNPFDVRRCIGASLLSDYSNLKSMDEFGLEKQTWSNNLRQKGRESLAAWRDRLYHEFRIPYVLAALTDLKCCYVEVINPLFSRRMIEQTRRMPDCLRTNKALFKKLVYSMSPKIGFAKHAAIEDPKNILKGQEVVNLISNKLDTTYAKTLLSEHLIKYILQNLEVADSSSATKKTSLKLLIKPFVPQRLRNALTNVLIKSPKKLEMDFNVLAFRAYIICKMNQLLSRDAAALQHGGHGECESASGARASSLLY